MVVSDELHIFRYTPYQNQMTPYTVVDASRFQKFLNEKADSVLLSEEFKVACNNLEKSPENLVDELMESLLAFEFPAILEESKIVTTRCCVYNKRNDIYFPVNEVVPFLDEKESAQNFADAIKRYNDSLIPNQFGQMPPRTRQFKEEDYRVYKYFAYEVELPISGSHEIVLHIISNEDAFNPSIKTWRLNLDARLNIQKRFKNTKVGFATTTLSWPLPDEPTKLTQSQIDVFKERAKNALVILNHAFRKAHNDFAAWQIAARAKLLEIISDKHKAENLRLLTSENQKSGYDEVLKKLMDF